MKASARNCLPAKPQTAMMRGVALASFFLLSATAVAQEKAASSEDLDVTMQIILDPNAKQPEEIVRRIPLPVRKPPGPAAASSDPGKKDETPPAAADKGQERAREAQEMGREMSQSAKERAQEANDQREQARRSVVDERQPPKPPNPPNRPPR